MTVTKYVNRHTIPLTTVLYVKPKNPVVNSPWAADVIAETQNTDQHIFAGLDPDTPYDIYVQAGVSVADTDVAIGQIEIDIEAALDGNLVVPDSPYSYSDTVTSLATGDPLDGATVWLVGVGLNEAIDATSTNALGEFTVNTDAEGAYELVIQETGYASRRVPITIS